MFKHMSNDCTALKLALCLALILPATHAFDFKPPADLFSVNAQGVLEKFQLTPQNFMATEYKLENDKFAYQIHLTAPKRTILVLKHPKNINPKKLENTDCTLIIGPGTFHSVGISAEVDNQVQHSNAFDLWNKLETDGKLGTINHQKFFISYFFEDFPPNLVEQLTGNNSTVFELINTKYFDSVPGKYLELKDANPLTRNELFLQFKKYVLDNLEINLNAFFENTIYKRRDALKNSYNCLNFFDRCAHTENAERFKKLMEYIKEYINKGINTSVIITFNDFYTDVIVKLISEEGIKRFIEEEVKTKTMNLVLEMMHVNFSSYDFNDYNYYSLGFGPSRNPSIVQTGNLILETMINNFLNFVKRESFAAYNETQEGDLGQMFKTKFEAVVKQNINTLNNLLKSKYSEEFIDNEKETLLEEFKKSADFMGFMSQNIREKVRETFEGFIFNYIKATVNYTMLNELMLIAPKFNPHYTDFSTVFLNKSFAKIASNLNYTDQQTVGYPSNYPLVFGE